MLLRIYTKFASYISSDILKCRSANVAEILDPPVSKGRRSRSLNSFCVVNQCEHVAYTSAAVAKASVCKSCSGARKPRGRPGECSTYYTNSLRSKSGCDEPADVIES